MKTNQHHLRVEQPLSHLLKTKTDDIHGQIDHHKCLMSAIKRAKAGKSQELAEVLGLIRSDLRKHANSLGLKQLTQILQKNLNVDLLLDECFDICNQHELSKEQAIAYLYVELGSRNGLSILNRLISQSNDHLPSISPHSWQKIKVRIDTLADQLNLDTQIATEAAQSYMQVAKKTLDTYHECK